MARLVVEPLVREAEGERCVGEGSHVADPEGVPEATAGERHVRRAAHLAMAMARGWGWGWGLGLGLGLWRQVSRTARARSTCGARHTWSGSGSGLGRAADLREGCARHVRGGDAEGCAAGVEALRRHAQLALAHPRGVHATQHRPAGPLRGRRHRRRRRFRRRRRLCRRRLPLHGAARLPVRQHGRGGGGGVSPPVDVGLRLLRVVEG